ncbi:electron transport complex subunit RsxD [Pseudaeromonas paramecii]|uniref:Ion-translocating oxidoreductase complex subunit D n=1 Tax=Pseudaeromonas paramecii TaxID=2138166 RepID=A0ABP8QCQ9_9GAMM
MAFSLAISPHSHSQQTTGRLMRLVLLALLPGLITQWFLFGWGVIFQLLLCGATALATEALVLRLRQRPLTPLFDSSALLTASLLAVALPPLAPWYVAVIGSAFAILVAKQLYGGLGQNPFNPAMVAYVLLLVSFPGDMTGWLPAPGLAEFSVALPDAASAIFTGFTPDGYSVHQLKLAADGTTMATPLDTLKTGLKQGHALADIQAGPTFSHWAGAGWQWINLAYLMGGLFLVATGTIAWQIPVGLLLGLGGAASLAWGLAPDHFALPTLDLFSGATMLGAFFIATDPVTAATTVRGRLIYGLLIGLLVFLIRHFGGYPDGMAFAVLLANIGVPLLDKLTRPKAYGEVR